MLKSKLLSFDFSRLTDCPLINLSLHTIAILLLGEPVRWETNLQLIIDVLVTNGRPYSSPVSPTREHIPVIVANTDLIYMSEVPLPRYKNK